MYLRSLAVCLIGFGLILAACGGGDDSESANDSADSTTETAAPATTEPADDGTSTSTSTTERGIPLGDLLPALDTLGPLAAIETDPVHPSAMCPGWDQFDGLAPIETAFRTFHGDPAAGPFLSIGLLDFPPGEAEAFLDAYIAGAAGPCAQYETVGAGGNPLNLGWSEAEGTAHGDRTVTMAVRGDSSGTPVNSDLVLVRVGERVGYVGYLTIGALPDAATLDAATDAIVTAIDGENVGVVEIEGSAAAISAVLPGLDELANPELLDEAFDPVLPNHQCPSNLSTLQGLMVLGAGARRFLADQDFGPHVTVSILEFGPGEADEFIDRWVDGANGPCQSYLANGLEFRWSVGSGPEYLDRTATLFGRGRQVALDEPSSADYVLIRSGDFVGYLHYFLVGAEAPNSSTRDTMVTALVEALEQLSA